MKIIVLGGDGFCGWASALRLSKKGHDVSIIDNLSRRKIDRELKAGDDISLLFTFQLKNKKMFTKSIEFKIK